MAENNILNTNVDYAGDISHIEVTDKYITLTIAVPQSGRRHKISAFIMVA